MSNFGVPAVVAQQEVAVIEQRAVAPYEQVAPAAQHQAVAVPSVQMAAAANQFLDGLKADYGDRQAGLLRDAWYGKEAENFAITRQMALDHPEIERIAERFERADAPVLLAIGAYIAKASGYRYSPTHGAATRMTESTGQPAAAAVPAEMQQFATMPDVQFDDVMDAKQREIEEAQARGNSGKANRLYAEKMAMRLARPGGNQPEVGKRGRIA